MNNKYASFNALLLAGGQSSRMGQDKALLRCPNGETLLQRASVLLKRTGANQVLVSSHNPAVAAYGTLAVSPVLEDHFPNRGPVSGIHAALRACNQMPLLILPVDMPLMQQSLLQALIQTGLTQQKSCCYEDQCLPLFIFDTRSASEKANVLLSDKENVSVWRFIKNVDAVELETDEKAMFKNANDPKQWQECQALMSLNN